MKKIKGTFLYLLTIGAFVLLMGWIVDKGSLFEQEKKITPSIQHSASLLSQLIDTYHQNVTHPLAIFLLQIITVIVVARLFGLICRKFGQPTVVGEIIAGIFLGPSFVGMFFPQISSFLFPPESLGNLQFLSQIGLILFMFVVGMELDVHTLKNKAHEAIVVSHASIVLPFALGMGLAYFIYSSFAPENVRFVSFALFLGIAMSITAFPVLARIIQERGMSKTKIGAMAITCAAADDITAWCLLAAVIAIVKAGSIASSMSTILMAVGYVVFMLKIVRPFLKRLGTIYSSKENLSKPIVAGFFVVLLSSAYATEIIGIHALFGAFMAGVIMPTNQNFRSIFIEKVEDVALGLFLPLFFVFTGLRTQIGLLDDLHLWGMCGAIILIAITGKFLGSALAAKCVGQSWRESFILGTLMNTRGLMELVVLNIGYDLGVLSPEIFAMMILMALVTTFMTGPALDFIDKVLPERAVVSSLPGVEKEGRYRVLISFGNPLKGKVMLRVAEAFVKKIPSCARITALHLSPSSDLNLYNTTEYERESFEPIEQEAKILNLPIATLFKASTDIDKEIVQAGNSGEFDLMLIGAGQSIYEGSLLGKILRITTQIINPEKIFDKLTGKEKLFTSEIFDERTRNVLRSVRIPVGILIDKQLQKIESLLVFLFSTNDSFLLHYAERLVKNADAKAIIVDTADIVKQSDEMQAILRSIEEDSPAHIIFYEKRILEKEFLTIQDLMLISFESWKKVVATRSIWLAHAPSMLILKP